MDANALFAMCALPLAAHQDLASAAMAEKAKTYTATYFAWADLPSDCRGNSTPKTVMDWFEALVHAASQSSVPM